MYWFWYSTGDSVGPVIGSMLKKYDLKDKCFIYGVLKNTVNATNVERICKEIYSTHKNPFIIAIDASITDCIENVGTIIIDKKPVYPANAMGKEIKGVGDISILLNIAREKINTPIFRLLQSVPYLFVYDMAEVTSKALVKVLA